MLVTDQSSNTVEEELLEEKLWSVRVLSLKYMFEMVHTEILSSRETNPHICVNCIQSSPAEAALGSHCEHSMPVYLSTLRASLLCSLLLPLFFLMVSPSIKGINPG